MINTIQDTDFVFPEQKSVYRGKVREVYRLKSDLMVMIATDRISAFDVVLPKGIPFKGQVLNQIAGKFLDATKDIVPNWKLLNSRRPSLYLSRAYLTKLNKNNKVDGSP